MEPVEAMDIDDATYSDTKHSFNYLDYEDKENKPNVNKLTNYDHSTVDLDASELEMKLRFSCTPSKVGLAMNGAGDGNVSLFEQSLNKTVDMSIYDDTLVENHINNQTLETQNETTLTNGNTPKNSTDNIEKEYVNNEPPKPTSSPIFRGIQSVLNMFRPSQSPITPSATESAREGRTPSPNSKEAMDQSLCTDGHSSHEDSQIIFNLNKVDPNKAKNDENLKYYSSNDSINDHFEECLSDSTHESEDKPITNSDNRISNLDINKEGIIDLTETDDDTFTTVQNNTFEMKTELIQSDICQVNSKQLKETDSVTETTEANLEPKTYFIEKKSTEISKNNDKSQNNVGNADVEVNNLQNIQLPHDSFDASEDIIDRVSTLNNVIEINDTLPPPQPPNDSFDKKKIEFNCLDLKKISNGAVDEINSSQELCASTHAFKLEGNNVNPEESFDKSCAVLDTVQHSSSASSNRVNLTQILSESIQRSSFNPEPNHSAEDMNMKHKTIHAEDNTNITLIVSESVQSASNNLINKETEILTERVETSSSNYPTPNDASNDANASYNCVNLTQAMLERMQDTSLNHHVTNESHNDLHQSNPSTTIVFSDLTQTITERIQNETFDQQQLNGSPDKNTTLNCANLTQTITQCLQNPSYLQQLPNDSNDSYKPSSTLGFSDVTQTITESIQNETFDQQQLNGSPDKNTTLNCANLTQTITQCLQNSSYLQQLSNDSNNTNVADQQIKEADAADSFLEDNDLLTNTIHSTQVSSQTTFEIEMHNIQKSTMETLDKCVTQSQLEEQEYKDDSFLESSVVVPKDIVDKTSCTDYGPLNSEKTKIINSDLKEVSNCTHDGSFYFSAENSVLCNVENVTPGLNIASEMGKDIQVEISPEHIFEPSLEIQQNYATLDPNNIKANEITLTEEKNVDNNSHTINKDDVKKGMDLLQQKIDFISNALTTEKVDKLDIPSGAQDSSSSNPQNDKIKSSTSFDSSPNQPTHVLEEFFGGNNSSEFDSGFVIDANTFNQLMSQNSSKIPAEGKESLFIKFDPLFRQSIYNGRQIEEMISFASPPCRDKPDILKCYNTQADEVLEEPTELVKTNNALQSNGAITNTSYTTEKPIMAVCPAFNSVETKISSPVKPTRQSTTYCSPAFAATEQLISLCTPPSARKPTIDVEALKQNLLEMQTLVQEKEVEKAELNKENKILHDKLSTREEELQSLKEILEKAKKQQKEELNKHKEEETGIKKVIEGFEKTIARMISTREDEKRKQDREMAKVTKERDEQAAHLKSIAYSYNDVLAKYETLRSVLLEHKDDQAKYMQTIEQYETRSKILEDSYDQLKQHATKKLNEANIELAKMKKSFDTEIVRLKTMIRKKDVEVSSLAESLSQKDKDYKQLSSICDELLAKVSEK